jgi:hypothetical protein
MALDQTGSEKRGTVKNSRGQFRTPKLSDAEKRRRKLERQQNKTISLKGLKPRKQTNTNPDFVPF